MRLEEHGLTGFTDWVAGEKGESNSRLEISFDDALLKLPKSGCPELSRRGDG